MLLHDKYHLSYCTNIHPGESWEEVFQSLQTHSIQIKRALSPDHPFGLGLRLSDQASRDILDADCLASFKQWLEDEGLYVFTMNGFPYGSFHREVVKDAVHQPDWTTIERKDYTIRLFNILHELLPEGEEGSISTSPVSYKLWYKKEEEIHQAFVSGTRHIAEVALHLHKLEKASGKWMHLDIEPEPDGLIENTPEVLAFYETYLIPIGVQQFIEQYDYSAEEAEQWVRRYVQLCYDVCHYAIAFETPEEVFATMKEAKIRIGKIQISAALKADLPADQERRDAYHKAFSVFNESTYLHQVIARKHDGSLVQYNDLPEALKHIQQPEIVEWRTHFHVPIFEQSYHLLYPTQDAIIEVLKLLKQEEISYHWEVETYTWEVLPEDMRSDLTSSISRELQWVLNEFNG